MPIVIDDREMLSVSCTFCSRLRSSWPRRCDAFPRKIPDEIWEGRKEHIKPIDGDHDLQFNWLDQPDGRESEYAV